MLDGKRVFLCVGGGGELNFAWKVLHHFFSTGAENWQLSRSSQPFNLTQHSRINQLLFYTCLEWQYSLVEPEVLRMTWSLPHSGISDESRFKVLGADGWVGRWGFASGELDPNAPQLGLWRVAMEGDRVRVGVVPRVFAAAAGAARNAAVRHVCGYSRQ